MVAPPMFLCEAGQTVVPLGPGAIGRNPPSKKPQVTPAAFSRSPMFFPPMAIVEPEEQTSNIGSASPVLVPAPRATAGPAWPTPVAHGVGVRKKSAEVGPQVTPKVLPAITLSAPGVDGPKTLL